MRIGLDYLPAVTHSAGVGRWARELVRALVRLDDAPELRLLELGGAARTIGEPALGLADAPARVRRMRLRVPRRLAAPLLRGLGADRLLGGIALFQRAHAHWPPLARVPGVQPISELPRPGSAEEERLVHGLAGDEHALVFSRHAALELARLGVDPARVHQVPVGAEHWARTLDSPPGRDQPPLVVVLGGVHAERHHASVVTAFERLWERERAGRLLLLGARGDAADELEARLARSSAREAVHWIERPREGHYPGAVARAACLVHLAEREATPVTPLEALALGTPVVASRLPAFEEALGGEARLVDTDAARADPELLATALEEACASALDPFAEARRREVAARFTWTASAAATLAAWRRIVARA